MEFEGKTISDDGKSRPDFLMLALLFKVASTKIPDVHEITRNYNCVLFSILNVVE